MDGSTLISSMVVGMRGEAGFHQQLEAEVAAAFGPFVLFDEAGEASRWGTMPQAS